MSAPGEVGRSGPVKNDAAAVSARPSAAQAPAPQPAPPAPASMRRASIYVAASVLLWLTQGLGMNFIAVNTYQIQGSLGATLAETNWLTVAYMAPSASLTLLLIKIRTQFGLRRFAEVSLVVFVSASLLHLFIYDLWSALPVRFLAGAAAAPISSLGFLYMLDAFPPARKMSWGLSLALTCSTAAPIVARIISPMLLDLGGWQQLYIMEIGLALMSLAVVYLLPLTPIPHAKVLHWRDFVTYPLIAIGFGVLTAALTLGGRYYWWLDTPWIGVCLAIAAITLTAAAAVEFNRDTPLVNIQWLLSPEILRFTVTLLVFRIVLSEQTSGAVGMFQMLGLLNEQSHSLNVAILLCSIAGGLICGAVLKLERESFLRGLALGCIMVGAYLDASATNLTRPQNMYASQALIAFGSALFLPPALLAGLTKALRQGPAFMTSFVMIFLFTQNIGGQIGSAAFGTFVIVREKFHSSHLIEQITLSNPLVAARVGQLSGAYGKILGDQQLLHAEGIALLAQQVTREANILAYNDAFLSIAIIAAIALAAMLVHSAYGYLGRRLGREGYAPA